MKINVIRENMDRLPDEIMLLIFNYFSGYDLTMLLQRVCMRWKYLINMSEKIWKGDVKLKGITEQQCQNKLSEVLRKTPRLKYLQIGNPYNSTLQTGNGKEEDVKDTFKTICFYCKDLEYLHVIDRFPLFNNIQPILESSKFKRLKVTFDKLCERREKIKDLNKIFENLPHVDNLCIDFRHRIQFFCEKKNSVWTINLDTETDASDEFA